MGGRSGNSNRNSGSRNQIDEGYKNYLEMLGYEDTELTRQRYELYLLSKRFRENAKVKKAKPIPKNTHSRYHI